MRPSVSINHVPELFDIHTVTCVQVLLNMAVMPDLAEQLEQQGAPQYIHGMNVVRLRRPYNSASRAPPSMLHLLSEVNDQLSRDSANPVAVAGKDSPKAVKK